MGMTSTDIDLLLELRSKGVVFARIATIGLQSLYLHRRQVSRLKVILPNSKAVANYKWGQAADSILMDITGAKEVVSIDISSYEGATIIHDMNAPLSISRPDLKGSFDLVIDGGTLEHVFHFPNAVSNLMFLVRLGGYLLTANPANNLCGHGFYQFSPEVMFRIYSPSNGFRLDRIILTESRRLSIEMDAFSRSYWVIDPMLVNRRILVRNRDPVMIRVLAERTTDFSNQTLSIQQSDYVATWSASSKTESDFRILVRAIFSRLPLSLQSRMREIVYRQGLRNSSTMKRWRGSLN